MRYFSKHCLSLFDDNEVFGWSKTGKSRMICFGSRTCVGCPAPLNLLNRLPSLRVLTIYSCFMIQTHNTLMAFSSFLCGRYLPSTGGYHSGFNTRVNRTDESKKSARYGSQGWDTKRRASREELSLRWSESEDVVRLHVLYGSECAIVKTHQN